VSNDTLPQAADKPTSRVVTFPPSSPPSHLAEIYSNLGADAVLLPLLPGRKGCVLPGWTKITWAATQTPAYQSELAAGDLAVLLGNQGNGICTLDLDDDKAVDEFLALNPKLVGTLRTRGARGCNLWFRINGPIPKSGPLLCDDKQVGEWRADGNATKIWGTHPDTGLPYTWLVAAAPLTVSFDEIVWPSTWSGACIKTDYDRLVENFGVPFQASGSGIRLNQTFIAAKFAFENRVLFEADENRFYIYDDKTGVWEHVTEAAIKTMLLAEILAFSRTQDPRLKERFELARTDQLATSIMMVLRGQVERRGAFAQSRRIVHVLNGIIELGAAPPVLRSFSPDYYSRNQIPVVYDPAATCPRFIEELLKPALSDDDIEVLRKWFGGLLIGGNLAQKLLIQEGAAGTGKGTFAAIVELILGSRNVIQLRTELLHERFETARFIGKRLLAGRDVPGDFLSKKGASVLKAITGGDSLDTELKNSMTAPSLRSLDVLVTTNSRLRVRLDQDTAAWARRILIVHYCGPQPTKPIPEFAALLFREEGPGILNWALAGAVALLHDLDVHGRFQITDEQKGGVEALLAESDSLRAFLRAQVSTHAGADVTTDELCEAYARYCDRMGWRPLRAAEVERLLRDLMLELFNNSRRNDVVRGGKAKRGYVGVAVKMEDPAHA
jgi:P4 family phage/plasmid primase-like protien